MRIATAFGTNLAGQGARLAIALLTVPFFASYFGAARFGTYYFLLALMPYFQIHALAVARQVTALSAQAAADDGAGERFLSELGASVAIGTIISIVLTSAFFLAYPFILQGVESYATLDQEITSARPWAAAIVLLDVVIVLQTAQMEGRRAFVASNVAQVIGQAASFVLPLTVLIYDGTFDQMIAGVALGRLVQVLVGLKWAPLLPILALARDGLHMPRKLGIDFGMLTISSICNAISRTLDRILIGTSVSASALFFYAAPLGATARLAVLGRAMGATMAPYFAVADEAQRKAQAGKASDATLAILLPLCIGGIVCAPLLLTVWVDAEFAARAVIYFRLGLVAVIGGAIAQVPAILLQSTGRSKWVTAQHLVELPPFTLALFLAANHSLTAVAWVVTLRTILAGLAHMVIARLPVRSIIAAGSGIALALGCAVASPQWDGISPVTSLAAAVAAALAASLFVHLISPETLRFVSRQIAARVNPAHKAPVQQSNAPDG